MRRHTDVSHHGAESDISSKCDRSLRSTSRDKASGDGREGFFLSATAKETSACGQLRRRARDDKIRAFEFYLAEK